jgi:hypothetical protein
MKELGIAMDFQAKRITTDDITLAVIALTICKKHQHNLDTKAK